MISSSSLPSRSILAAALLPLLAACGPVVLADGGGGSTTTTTTSSGPTTTSSTSSSTLSSNACTQAGGSCAPAKPNSCLDSFVIGDPSQYPCGTGEECCLPAPCPYPCSTLNATQCAGGSIQTCQATGFCGLGWVTTSACPSGETCNSDGTKCISTPAQCTTAADCPCECTCTSQGVCGDCTGAIPPSCTQDSQCGPVCAGYHCVSGTCQMK